MSAQTVLEELTRDELTREHVQSRVDDWVVRIESLYDYVMRQLPAGWSARRGLPVTMLEPLMKRLGVPQRELPTLELLRDGTVSLRFRPYGLWIIGVNGRIDLVKGRDFYVIDDRAMTFEAPSWYIAAVSESRDSEPFDDAKLAELLHS